MGTCTATSSRKVIACEIMPLSLLLNTLLGGSSQQSLVQEAASLMPVSSQNTLTSGETPTSCAFPFGHCHCRPRAASPTLCRVREYTLNHRELSTSPSTSSCVINCPMLRTVRVDGQTSHPWTLMLHCQMVRRHLASERATPLAPTVSSVTKSYQGTSSSGMPWTANCSQQVALKVGSTVSSISSSSPMSIWYPVCCPGLPLECSSLPSAEDRQLSSSHRIMWRTGVCRVWKSSSMPRPDGVRPGPSPHQSDWTGRRWER